MFENKSLFTLNYITLLESYIVNEISHIFIFYDWRLNYILKEIFDIS